MVKKQALIVDDSRDITLLSSRYFKMLGWETEAADCGSSALELFQNDPDRFQVIVSDYYLGDMKGDELHASLKGILADKMPLFMLVSGHDDIAKIAKGLSFAHALKKPFMLDDLRGVLRTYKLQD